jgi:hypothetical protein
MPVRAWVDEGALIAAGSDCNVSFFDPLLSIWGLVTRGTRTVGVQGAEYRVDTYTALRLYTEAGGRRGWWPAVVSRPLPACGVTRSRYVALCLNFRFRHFGRRS